MFPKQQRQLEAQISGDIELEGLKQLACGVLARAVADLLISRQETRIDALFFAMSPEFEKWAWVAGYLPEELPAMRRKLVQRWKDALAGMKAGT
jgi:hypothetical protein